MQSGSEDETVDPISPTPDCLHILVVEDNPITMKMVRITLQTEGYEVWEAPTGQVALDRVQRQRPDLILQDLMLPDIDGVDLVQQLRNTPGGAEIPIVCFSGFVSRVEEARVAGAGFTDFLVKPVEPSQLAQTVRTYLPAMQTTGEQPGKGRDALVVDDDPVQQKLLGLLLGQAGFSVRTASEGHEALALAQTQRPDVIVSDILMPGMDGFQLCYALRRHPTLGDVPIVLVSANYVEEPDRAFAARLGANSYVARGQSGEGIVEAVTVALRAGHAPATQVYDETELEAERHQRIVRQLELQVKLHAACVQRSVIQGAILHELSIISETLAKRRNFESALDEVLAYCLDAAGLSRGALYLAERGVLVLRAQYGFSKELHEAARECGDSELCRQAAQSGDAVALPNSRLTAATSLSFLKPLVAQSALIVPVQAAGESLGVFLLLSAHRELTQPDWLAFGRSLASQIAQTIMLSRAFYELSQSERRYRMLFEGARDGIFVTDEESRILDVNQAASRLSGYPLDDMKGMSVRGLIPDHFHAQLEALTADYTRTGQLVAEMPLRAHDGAERLVHVAGSRIAPGLYVNIARDITEERQAQDIVQRLAYTDTLTELANRTALHARLVQAIQVAQTGGELLALLVMDLDDFREINDTLGHRHGDALLIQVAGRLKAALWEPDLVARLGGDEFAVLLTRLAQAQHIRIVVRKIEQALATPFLVEGMPIDVRITIGVALYPLHGDNADMLLRRADMAMHLAKDTRQRHLVYDPATDRADTVQLALIAELREAIHADRLTLYYQPKINVVTGLIDGLEVLARWPHPERGMIAPDQFIPMAERTGLISPLTAWVLGNALRQVRAWREAGHEFEVSVNLSARDLQQADIVEEIEALVRNLRVPPAALTLEVTESAVMLDPEGARRKLAQLRAFGVHIAIDDFGIGHSSLAYLKALPVDYLKIDKSFVIDFKDEGNAAIVRSTIELAHNLGFEVTAEGVEDGATLTALRDLGCDLAQGYHIARPMPAGEVVGWLER